MKRAIGILTAAIVAVLVLSFSAETKAEVSAQLDRDGTYLWTRVAPLGHGEGSVWSARRGGVRFRGRGQVLNPIGARRGDLWPAMVESPVAPNHPWVVWSRNDGDRFNLVFSRWTNGRWRLITPIDRSYKGSADDIEPSLMVDSTGRPYAVWSRREGGRSAVFFSAFLLGPRWSEPFQVSRVGVNAGSPSIRSAGSGQVDVQYTTPAGNVTTTVSFQLPVTITDDINPQLTSGPGSGGGEFSDHP